LQKWGLVGNTFEEMAGWGVGNGQCGQDIKPFAKFLGYLVGEGLKGKPVASI
jgi:hypothetical protein